MQNNETQSDARTVMFLFQDSYTKEKDQADMFEIWYKSAEK